MVFANEEHEKFYFEKLEQPRYQDNLVLKALEMEAADKEKGQK